MKSPSSNKIEESVRDIIEKIHGFETYRQRNNIVKKIVALIEKEKDKAYSEGYSQAEGDIDEVSDL